MSEESADHAGPKNDITWAMQEMQAGRLTSEQLLERALQAAQKRHDLNPIARADWQGAKKAALEADAQWAKIRAGDGTAPRLLGIPISIKDLFSVKGMAHFAGTEARLPDFGPGESTLVTRLRDAGAIIFAKTNMHEIALGATGENVWTGDVKNPYDPAHQAGGSSSGAAVSVATGIGMAAVGSDTGGSVRIPAAFCGLVGFKPSFDAIPLDNALYLSWTCDHAGPLTLSVEDSRTLFEVMSQRSTRHASTRRSPTLGVPRAWLKNRLAVSVRENFDQHISRLRAQGVEIVDLALPDLPLAWQCYSPIVRAEAASIHRQALEQDDGKGFSDAVLAPLRAGQEISALDYIAALEMRTQVCTDLDAALAQVDAIMLPTTAVPAPKRGQENVAIEGGETSVREAVLGQTLPFSLCGLPSLSMPCGRVGQLPIGMSLIGARDGDAALLALCSSLEQGLRA